MYVTIISHQGDIEVYEVTPETRDAIREDAGCDLVKTYDTLSFGKFVREGKFDIVWRNVGQVKFSEDVPPK